MINFDDLSSLALHYRVTLKTDTEYSYGTAASVRRYSAVVTLENDATKLTGSARDKSQDEALTRAFEKARDQAHLLARYENGPKDHAQIHD